MTYIREYHPECPQSDCVSFPGGDSNLKVAGGARRKINITPLQERLTPKKSNVGVAPDQTDP